MTARLQQLGKDSLIYGIGGIISRGVGFFLIPVYTRVFTPAEYGTIEMLNVLSSFLGALLVMGMDVSQGYYYFEQKKYGPKAQAQIISAVLHWKLVWGTGILTAAVICWSPLNALFFNGQLTWSYFLVSFTGVFFFQIMIQGAEVLRLLDRPRGFIGLELGQTLISAALILWFVISFDLGILGFIWGVLLGAVVSTLAGWWGIRDHLIWSRECWRWWPRLMKFSAPLVPNVILIYLLNSCDRWFVSHYKGQGALGLYAVGAKFALLIYIGANMFRLAWWPVALDAMHSEDGPELFRTMARLYLGVGTIAVVLITLMSPYILTWLTTPVYAPAYPIIGILSWYAVFFGFYLIGAAGILKSEKTFISPVLIGVAVVCDLLLNYFLVPVFGGVGAALSTSTAFGIWIILAVCISERLWPVHHRFVILISQLLIGIMACVFILYSYHYQLNRLFPLLITSVTIVILAILSVSRSQVKMIKNVFKGLMPAE